MHRQRHLWGGSPLKTENLQQAPVTEKVMETKVRDLRAASSPARAPQLQSTKPVVRNLPEQQKQQPMLRSDYESEEALLAKDAFDKISGVIDIILKKDRVERSDMDNLDAVALTNNYLDTNYYVQLQPRFNALRAKIASQTERDRSDLRVPAPAPAPVPPKPELAPSPSPIPTPNALTPAAPNPSPAPQPPAPAPQPPAPAPQPTAPNLAPATPKPAPTKYPPLTPKSTTPVHTSSTRVPPEYMDRMLQSPEFAGRNKDTVREIITNEWRKDHQQDATQNQDQGVSSPEQKAYEKLNEAFDTVLANKNIMPSDIDTLNRVIAGSGRLDSYYEKIQSRLVEVRAQVDAQQKSKKSNRIFNAIEELRSRQASHTSPHNDSYSEKEKSKKLRREIVETSVELEKILSEFKNPEVFIDDRSTKDFDVRIQAILGRMEVLNPEDTGLWKFYKPSGLKEHAEEALSQKKEQQNNMIDRYRVWETSAQPLPRDHEPLSDRDKYFFMKRMENTLMSTKEVEIQALQTEMSKSNDGVVRAGTIDCKKKLFYLHMEKSDAAPENTPDMQAAITAIEANLANETPSNKQAFEKYAKITLFDKGNIEKNYTTQGPRLTKIASALESENFAQLLYNEALVSLKNSHTLRANDIKALSPIGDVRPDYTKVRNAMSDIDAVEPEASNTMFTHKRMWGIIINRGFNFQKLKSIPPEELKSLCNISEYGMRLGRYNDFDNTGTELKLNSLSSISMEHAGALQCYLGEDVELNGVTELTPDVAKILGKTNWSFLELNGLQNLSPETCTELESYRSTLFLNGLKEIDVENAKILANYKGPKLSLSGLTHLTKDIAGELQNAHCQYLMLDGVASISDDVAEALSSSRRALILDLSGVKEWPESTLQKLQNCQCAFIVVGDDAAFSKEAINIVRKSTVKFVRKNGTQP